MGQPRAQIASLNIVTLANWGKKGNLVLSAGQAMDSITNKLQDCQNLIDEGEFEQALVVAQDIVSQFPEDGEQLILGKAHQVCSKCCVDLVFTEQATSHAEAASEIFHQCGDLESYWECQLRITQIILAQRDLNWCRHTASQALSAARKEGWKYIEALALNLMAQIAYHERNNKLAIEQFMQAKALFELTGKTQGLENLCFCASICYLAIGDLDQSDNLLRQANKYSAGQDSPMDSLKFLFNLQLQTWMYQDLEQFRLISLQITRALESIDSPLPHIIASGNLGLLEIALGNYPEARKCLLRSWQLARENNVAPRQQAGTLTSLGLIALYENDSAKALNYMRMGLEYVSGTGDIEEQVGKYYLAIGMLANNHHQEANQHWDRSNFPRLSAEMAIEYDWMSGLLRHLQSKEFLALNPLSVEALSLAEEWNKQISALTQPPTPPPDTNP